MAVKRTNFTKNILLLVEFSFVHKRVSVKMDDKRLCVSDDKCRHRGGPVHLCYTGEDGISRCPWHDRPIGSAKKTGAVAAIYWKCKKEITLIADVKADVVWPVKTMGL